MLLRMTKRSMKKVGIAALVCFGCIALFTIIGTIASKEQYCDHVWPSDTNAETMAMSTCVEEVVMLEKCQNCSETRMANIRILGHSMTEIYRIEATHEMPGMAIMECSRCGHRETIEIPVKK